MRITRTQKAQGLAYPLARVKDHLRVSDGNEDGLISAYINAAVDFIASYTWIYLQSTSYTAYLDDWESETIIKMHPVTAISSIKYYDANGTLQTMSAGTDYYVSLNGAYARINFENTYTLRDQPYDNIEIAFTCGYASHFEIPDDLVDALLMLVSDMFENRQSFSQGVREVDVPMGIKAILNNNSKRTFC